MNTCHMPRTLMETIHTSFNLIFLTSIWMLAILNVLLIKKNWGSERVTNVRKTTQIERARPRIQA